MTFAVDCKKASHCLSVYAGKLFDEHGKIGFLKKMY